MEKIDKGKSEMSKQTNKFSAKAERARLKKIFKNVSPEVEKLVFGLIEDAAFMSEQLDMLRTTLIEKGWSETYQNGANQTGKKSPPEADAYVKLQRNYASTIKQLKEFLPNAKEQATAKAGDSLTAFINAGKPNQ